MSPPIKIDPGSYSGMTACKCTSNYNRNANLVLKLSTEKAQVPLTSVIYNRQVVFLLQFATQAPGHHVLNVPGIYSERLLMIHIPIIDNISKFGMTMCALGVAGEYCELQKK